MNAKQTRPASDQPDPDVLQRLSRFERRGLLLVELIAALTLLLWLAGARLPWVPEIVWAMKFNTAVGLLLLCQALRRSAPLASLRDQRIAVLAAAAVLALSTLALYGHLAGVALPIDTLIVQDRAQISPGRVPWPAAVTLLLAALCVLGQRNVRKLWARLADAAVIALIGIVLMLLSGFLFGATGWFGDAGPPPTAPQAMICLMLLGFVIAARRTQYGFNAVLVGIGIGSRIARTVLPYAIGLPFAFVLLRVWASDEGLLSRAYANGISVSLQALMFMGIVIWMAARINRLESELRHMSLADELTQVNNRRGFALLAEQALRVAHRERLPVMLFFFDLDGLKRINDTLGHDTGSDFIRKVAELLKTSFREGDVVGRIGGDEFVVLAIDHDSPAEETLRRIEALAEQKGAAENLPYAIAFSSGHAAVDTNAADALDQALQVADQRMYQAKTAKRAQR